MHDDKTSDRLLREAMIALATMTVIGVGAAISLRTDPGFAVWTHFGR